MPAYASFITYKFPVNFGLGLFLDSFCSDPFRSVRSCARFITRYFLYPYVFTHGLAECSALLPSQSVQKDHRHVSLTALEAGVPDKEAGPSAPLRSPLAVSTRSCRGKGTLWGLWHEGPAPD